MLTTITTIENRRDESLRLHKYEGKAGDREIMVSVSGPAFHVSISLPAGQIGGLITGLSEASRWMTPETMDD